MISLSESSIKLSVIAVFESLITRYECKNSIIEPKYWNEFAEYININKTTESLNSKQACNLINNYISGNGIQAINKICQFFNWNDIQSAEQDLLDSEQLIQKASENSNIVEKVKSISNSDIKKSKTLVFPNGKYIAAIYNKEDKIECIHVSIEKSIHKTSGGDFDLAEIGYFPDKICINLDTHSDYNDKNGYNDYYDLEIKNPNYNYTKYAELVEKILYFTNKN